MTVSMVCEAQIALCEALGLDPSSVRRMVVTFDASEFIPTVEVELLDLDAHVTGELAEVAKRFYLVPTEEP